MASHRPGFILCILFQPEDVIIDVSGPGAKPPRGQEVVKEMGDRIIIKMPGPLGSTPLPPLSETTTKLPGFLADILGEDENFDDLVSTVPPVTEATPPPGLPANRPVVLYLKKQHTGHKAKVLKVLPSLSALKNNELCDITDGNEYNLFTIHARKGISSLKFTRKIHRRGIYPLTVTCTPIVNEGKTIAASVKLEPFKISLELHIV